MKSLPYLAAALVLPLYTTPALASNQVTCESQDNKRATCSIGHADEVHMVKRLSKSECLRGEHWGYDRNSGTIWVDDGCRATFEAKGKGHSGGSSSSLPNRVTCESDDNRRQECEMDTRGEVRLSKQLSNTRCKEGENWGVNKHSVWVTDGCRAEFKSSGKGPTYDNDPAYGGAPAHSDGPSNAQIRACNAVDDDYGKVVSSAALKPGHWEIILDYSKGRYVCNVGPNNKVTYFEKLRH